MREKEDYELSFKLTDFEYLWDVKMEVSGGQWERDQDLDHQRTI